MTTGAASWCSTPSIRTPSRRRERPIVEALEAVDHLIGVALCFPTAKPGTEPVSTIQVELQQPSQLGAEEMDEYQDTEGSQDEVNLGDR